MDGAPPAETVAADYVELLSDRIRVSDAPEVDGRWIDMLTAILCRNRKFGILDFDTALTPSGLNGLRRAYAFLDASLPLDRNRCSDHTVWA